MGCAIRILVIGRYEHGWVMVSSLLECMVRKKEMRFRRERFFHPAARNLVGQAVAAGSGRIFVGGRRACRDMLKSRVNNFIEGVGYLPRVAQNKEANA